MAVTVQFYHLTTTKLERALPKLLEKALAGGYKILLVAGNDHQVEHLNHVLWTYDPGSFLPHGSAANAHADRQPVLLSTTFEAQNKANLLAVTSGAMPEQPEAFERIIDIFDGNDSDAVVSARNRWKLYKESGNTLTYFKQTESGGWEQKAVA